MMTRLVTDARCLVTGALCFVPGAWCPVPGARSLVSVAWCPVLAETFNFRALSKNKEVLEEDRRGYREIGDPTSHHRCYSR